MSEKFTLFWRGPFSQWHRNHPFKVDGIEYATAEQYMMAEKARLFGDKETEKKIMATTSPKDAKALGREVKGFDKGTWQKVARDIVYRGNYAKFTQHADLRNKLMATEGTTLVEASPTDAIWGIARTEGDPLALDRKTWKGTNWLGEVITQVREDLKAGVERKSFNWSG